MGIEVFKKHIREKRAIKITTRSYDVDNVINISKASQSAHASAVEIDCAKDLYKAAKKNTKLPIFISSIHPFEILNALSLGADGVTIGDFSPKYNNNKTFSAQEVYDITLEAMSLINKYDTFVCATIPENLDVKEQIALAKKFEILGVDLIQINSTNAKDIQEITQNILTPIILSETADNQNIDEAFLANINGLSVELNQTHQAAVVISSIVGKISYRNSINKEIIKTKRELVLN